LAKSSSCTFFRHEQRLHISGRQLHSMVTADPNLDEDEIGILAFFAGLNCPQEAENGPTPSIPDCHSHTSGTTFSQHPIGSQHYRRNIIGGVACPAWTGSLSWICHVFKIPNETMTCIRWIFL
jgi:hypothetical protein